MAEDETIRIVVKVNPSRHPELHEALKNNDGKAERIRSLALMARSGVAVSGGEARSDSESPKDQRKKTKPASATNDEGEKLTAFLPADPKSEDDPRRDFRESVVSGFKNSGF